MMAENNKARELLLVIDMQNDFIDGALGTPEARAIVENVVREIKKYPSRDVIATRDTHTPDYLETSEGRHLPVVHCVRGAQGWELAPAVAEALGGAEIVDKPGFGSIALSERLHALSEREEIAVTLISLYTDICVVSNALLLRAFLPEATLRVRADCCAGVTPESHRAALETMKMCQIEIV